MAKNAHGTRSDLIHCDNCGEDYSSTYKRCPFCGARPSNTQSAGRTAGGSSSRSSQSYNRSSRPEEDDDDYVFDGQDVFDDLDRDQGGSPFRGGGGGRHLSGGILDISPTTMIGFVVSGVIVVAAILIVLFVVIPMIRGGQVETETNSPNGSLPGTSQSQPVSPSPSQLPTADPSGDPSLDPSADPSGEPATDSPAPTTPVSPSPSPSTSVPPATGGLTIVVAYNGSARTEISISDTYPDPVRLETRGASGTVSWASNNTSVATVNSSGVVSGVGRGEAYVTATDAAGNSARLRVLVTLSNPSASTSTSPSPSPSSSQSPAPSPSPSTGGGTLTFSAFGNVVDDFTMSAANPNPVTLRVNGATGTVTWTSSNTSVATVNANGTVSMVGKGQCRVTATDAAGNSGSCIVRVN